MSDATPNDGLTPLDPDEAADLLVTGITTRDELNFHEQLNIIAAQQWTESHRQVEILSLDFVRELHRRMFGNVWKWAGTFRTTEKNIGVEPWKIAPMLNDLCGDAKTQIELQSFNADEIAYRFHHRLVQIHCFPNGNGRHARLMTDVMLAQLLFTSPFSWGSANLTATGDARVRYIQALRAADRGDYSLLSAFVRS